MDIRGKDQTRYWGKRAKSYGSQYGLDTMTTKIKVKRKVDLLFRHIRQSDAILEIGCGTGIYTKEIAERSNNFVASDLSLEMLEEAKKNNPKVEFRHLDARKLDVDDASYDVVISCFVLQHVDMVLVLPEIHRVLRTGGRMSALVPNILNPLHYGRARSKIARAILKENSNSEDLTRWVWERALKKYGFPRSEIIPVEFTSSYVPTNLANLGITVSKVLEKIPVVRELAGTLIITAWK